MKYTESELEKHIRELIHKTIIFNHPEIQMLESKEVTDIILCKNNLEKPEVFFIELKHYVSSNGRIGFGASGRVTFQPEILKTKPIYFESYTRWIFCDSNFENYFFLSNEDCRRYISGDNISYDKQNNFKLSLLDKEPKLSESDLIKKISQWVGIST